MAPTTHTPSFELEDTPMPVLDSDFDCRMSPTPPPCFPSLTSTLLSSYDPASSYTADPPIPSVLIEAPSGIISGPGGPTGGYLLRKRTKKRACVAGEDEAVGEVRTPRRPTALQLELARNPIRASPVKVSSPTHSRSSSSGHSRSMSSSSSHSRSASCGSAGTNIRSTSEGNTPAPATPRRRASGRGGELSKKRERRVSTRERINSPDKSNGRRGSLDAVGRSAGRSASDSSVVPLLHPPPVVVPYAPSYVPPPVTPTTPSRPVTYTKRKALPASSPAATRKGTNKGYKPLKSPSTPLKSPRARKATTSPSAKTASLGGIGGRWGSSNSASMLSVFARGLKKRIKGKRKADKALLKEKAKADAAAQGSSSKSATGGEGVEVGKGEGEGEMVISPPVSTVVMASPFPPTLTHFGSEVNADDEVWKRRGSVAMLDNHDDADDEQEEIELDSDDTDTDTPMSPTLPRLPTTAMQFLSISPPTPKPANPFVDEDFEMTAESSPVSVRKAQSRGKAMKVLGYEAHEAFKGALFASSLQM
ncbi:hypothetical protein MD484_g3759, partial [Candolleomyces efflorescens]